MRSIRRPSTKKCLKGCLKGRRQAGGGSFWLHNEIQKSRDEKQKIWLQETWIRFLSGWINVWMVFSRCNWPGLKTHASPASGQAHRQWRPEGLLKRQLSLISSPWGPLSAEVQRCRDRGQSGFRRGCSPSPAQGAMGPSILTKPKGTAHQTPEPRSLEKIKTSLLGTRHQMASFHVRFLKCPWCPFVSAHRRGCPSDCTCLLQVTSPQGLC